MLCSHKRNGEKTIISESIQEGYFHGSKVSTN